MARDSVPAAAGELPDSFDPMEIALDAERGDPAPDSPARTLLLEQIALTRQDQAHRRLQIASERFGAAMKLFSAAAGAVVAILVGTMLWDAHKASGLVIDAFSTPPDLAARGLTGQVAASRFLDEMRTLQDATDSARATASYGNDWSGSFKVEIPGSGISLDEVQRWLRGWLGHETHVSGEVVRTDQGLELSVRAGSAAGQTFKGTDLQALMKQAALALYKQQQPYRYAIWLQTNGRVEEGEAVLREITLGGPPAEQAFAMAGLANIACYEQHDCRRALALAEQARRLDPSAMKPWWNLQDAYGYLARSEDRLRVARTILAHRPDPMINPVAAAVVLAGDEALVAELTGDFAGGAAASERGGRLADYGGNRLAAMGQHVIDLYLAHEPAKARNAALIYGKPLQTPDFQRAIALSAAWALGDWRTVALSPLAGPADYDLYQRNPLIARGRARSGDLAGAEALTAGWAGDCYDCLVARGEIAALKGDQAGADRWLAEAARQAPSIPEAFLVWGEVKLARGDAAGAAALMAKAVAKGPRWSDAYSGWGRALLAQGDAKGALDKFQQADRLAPNWGRNHILLGEAYRRLGQPDAARREWLTARGLEITAGERGRLEYLLKGGR